MGGGKLSREARWNTGGVGAVTLWLDWHPIWGRGIVIFRLASCYGYPDKLWQDGPLGLGYRGTDLLLIQCWNFQSYKSLTTHLSKCLSTNGETSKSIKSWLVAYLVLMTNSSWKKTLLEYYKFTQFQRKKSHIIKSFDKIKKYTMSQNAFTRKHLPFHWGLVAVIWFLVLSMFPKLHEVMP